MVDNDQAEKEKQKKEEEKEQKRQEGIKKAKWIILYTGVVMLIAVFFMVAVWPAATEDLSLNATSTINSTSTFNAINELNSTRVVTLPILNSKFFIGPETLILFVMMISGAMGACVYSFWAVSSHLGKDDFDYEKWKMWYFTRPFVGAGLALFFYLLIRGGLLTIGAEFMTLNLVVIAGLSGLVGMFAEQAILKLNELADATFGAAPKKETKEKEKPTSGEGKTGG